MGRAAKPARVNDSRIHVFYNIPSYYLKFSNDKLSVSCLCLRHTHLGPSRSPAGQYSSSRGERSPCTQRAFSHYEFSSHMDSRRDIQCASICLSSQGNRGIYIWQTFGQTVVYAPWVRGREANKLSECMYG